MMGELIAWYLHDKNDSKEHHICVDFIEDYIDGDKDVIMKLKLCIAWDILFTTYIINAFAFASRYWVSQFSIIHDLSLLRCFISQKVLQCYCCDMWLPCSLWESSDNTWNDGIIRVKYSMFTKSTQASIHDKFDYKVLRWHNMLTNKAF